MSNSKSKDATGIPFLTPNEIEARHGVSAYWIRKNIRRGKLKAFLVEGRYYITKEEFKRWREQSKRGRPPKSRSQKKKPGR